MKSLRIIVNQDDLVGGWVQAQKGYPWIPGSGRCFGVAENGRLVAGVIFDAWNDASLHVHVTALPGRSWLSKGLAAMLADYAFNQVGARKVIGAIGEGREAAQRLAKRAGFTLEATLSNAHPEGDLFLFTMTREQAAKWLALAEKEPWNEQPETTAST